MTINKLSHFLIFIMNLLVFSLLCDWIDLLSVFLCVLMIRTLDPAAAHLSPSGRRRSDGRLEEWRLLCSSLWCCQTNSFSLMNSRIDDNLSGVWCVVNTHYCRLTPNCCVGRGGRGGGVFTAEGAPPLWAARSFSSCLWETTTNVSRWLPVWGVTCESRGHTWGRQEGRRAARSSGDLSARPGSSRTSASSQTCDWEETGSTFTVAVWARTYGSPEGPVRTFLVIHSVLCFYVRYLLELCFSHR